MRVFPLFCLLTFCFSHGQEQRTSPLSFEKDLIPEGIAIDAKTGKVYLNSLKYNKIVRCNLDGSAAEHFVASNEHGYLSGFGMTVIEDTLYALGNTLPKIRNKSILLKLNNKSGGFIDKYTINDDRFIYLNDIAVDNYGALYITDSESSNLYTVSYTNNLEIFFSHKDIKHSNGIAISSDGKLLYLATYTTGLRVLDIASKKLVNQPNNHKGIDGLKYHKGHLVGIVNGRRDHSQNGVFQFMLNPDGLEITNAEKIWEFENPTDVPTTFALYDDSMYFISDSQLRNFDQETNQIIEPDKLKNYTLVRLQL